MTRPAFPDPRFARFNQTAAGIDFAYLAGGQGPPVLLLHGWQLTSWSWRKILAPLADAGFTVIAPDLPGLGESGPAPEGYEKRTPVEPLRALLRALGHNRLLADVLAGVINPAPVLDLTLSLAEVPAGYAAMDARRATKVLVQVA